MFVFFIFVNDQSFIGSFCELKNRVQCVRNTLFLVKMKVTAVLGAFAIKLIFICQ